MHSKAFAVGCDAEAVNWGFEKYCSGGLVPSVLGVKPTRTVEPPELRRQINEVPGAVQDECRRFEELLSQDRPIVAQRDVNRIARQEFVVP